MMRWMTEAQVLKAAHKSDRAALLNSIAHWTQLASASKAKFLDAYEVDRVGIGIHFCALCMRHVVVYHNGLGCSGCPLHMHGDGCCEEVGVYQNVTNAFCPECYDYNHNVFRSAACKMRDLLIHLRDKHKDGDYSYAPDGKC